MPEKYRKILGGVMVAVGGLAMVLGVDFDVVAQGELVESLDGAYVAAGGVVASLGGLIAKFKSSD
jgi:hypothetical protein